MAPGTSTSSFKTEREAKEYLVARIVAEAKELGIELSEVERKMLYFTETGWTLPGIMDVNAEFERDYDNDEYEAKIAGIVRSIEGKNSQTGGDAQSLWDDALVKLSEGDHYLLVLIGLGRAATSGRFSNWLPSLDFYEGRKPRPAGDYFRLIVMTVALLLIFFGFVVLKSWISDRLR